MKGEPPDPVVRRWLATCGAALVLIACVALASRFADVRLAILPGGVPPPFATLAGLLVAGAALVALGIGRTAVGRAGAWAVLGFGFATLALYAVAAWLGWERFVYDEARAALSRGVGFDGQVSPNSAISFVLLGGALLGLGLPQLRAAPVAMAISVLLALAMMAIVGHATGLRFAVSWWRFTAMALPAAVSFLASGAVLLFWLMRRMAGAERAVMRTMPFFVGAGTVLIVLGAVIVVSNEQRLAGTVAMARTLELDAALDRFVASVARLESATRGFALSGDDAHLASLEDHRQQVRAALETLSRLTANHPQQHALAVALQPLVSQKFSASNAQIAARRERDVEAAAAALRVEGPALTIALRNATEALQEEQVRLLAEQRKATEIHEVRLQWVLVMGALLSATLIGAAFSLVQEAQQKLQGTNESLEQRVQQRTAELEASAAQLRESEQRWRFLADTMPQLVWTAGPDGEIENLNQGWKAFLAVATEDECRARLLQIIHPDDLARGRAEWDAMRRQHRAAGGEVRLLRSDGVYRWHLWRAHPERDSAGNILRWVGTCTDIHDQKLAEEKLEARVSERTAQLAASEARFRQAFEFAGIGMAIVGLDGRWLRVNKSACEILGYSDAELLQKTFQDITHPDDLAADLAHLRGLVEGKHRFYQMEKRYYHRAGHIVWVRLTVSIVRDERELPVHFVSQLEDINEHKRLEESLARARDQALEASRLKSEFLATMSHEIRTPMNGVIGMTALLRDTPLTAEQADYVRTIESSGESLLAIINDILDYSKIEAGRTELEISPFDLRRCVEDVLDLFAGRALEKKIELAYLVAPEVPGHVATDATRLRQILVNLLGNALKFTAAGEVLVTVESEAEGEKCRLKFAIKDTGIGIPEAGMSRLFKSFSQVDASTTRRFGGTGLGLAISKRLAELMGGTMWAESREGEGSTFYFTLLVDVVTLDPGMRVPEERPELHGRRLLIVDDNATHRRVIASLASSWGMAVVEAASGQEALAQAESELRCDVAVVDMELPDTTGDQLAGTIQTARPGAAMPVVLLTQIGSAHQRGEHVHTLAKPIKAEALRRALTACLRDQPVAVRSRAPFAATAIDPEFARRWPLRILIAEDNPVNQRVATLLLQRLGYAAALAPNGLAALEAVAREEFDVILMDVEMPEMDGREATRRIRARSGLATRPWIIALTAGAMQSDREQAFAAGMNDFLTKPVRPESLASALERASAALRAGAQPA